MSASVSSEGPSPICVTPCLSPPPRAQPATITARALLATPHPQSSLWAAPDSQPFPLATAPNDLHHDTSVSSSPLATSSTLSVLLATPNPLRSPLPTLSTPTKAAARWPRGKVSLRADLVREFTFSASSPASCFSRLPSLQTHPTTGVARSWSVLPLRGTFSLRKELMHAFISSVSYRVATEGPVANGISGLLAQKIRSLSMHEEGLKIPRHGWGTWPKALREPLPFRPDEAKVNLPTQLREASASARVRSEADLPLRDTNSQLTPLRTDATSQSTCTGRLTACCLQNPSGVPGQGLPAGRAELARRLGGGVGDVYDICPNHELGRGRPGEPGGAQQDRG